MKTYKKIIIFFTLLTLFGCGYEIVSKSKNNFNITEITTYGDPRTNYKIKNNLLFNSSKESQNVLIIDLKTNIKKTIKDKNIKNEITSYNLSLKVEVTYNFLGQLDKKKKFILNENGDFKVSNQRLNTLNNEKALKEILTESIINKIINRLNVLTNDY